MPDSTPGRRALLASAAALPVLLAAAGCRSSDAFTGPDPLAGPASPGRDVLTLQAVMAAEEDLIALYRTAIGGGPGPAGSAARDRAQPGPGLRSLLGTLLAEHEQHLARLRARLIVPPGMPPSPSPSRARPSSAAPAPVSLARLRAAEGASAASLVQRLATAPPALAQLFASIAASDATHLTVLGG